MTAADRDHAALLQEVQFCCKDLIEYSPFHALAKETRRAYKIPYSAISKGVIEVNRHFLDEIPSSIVCSVNGALPFEVVRFDLDGFGWSTKRSIWLMLKKLLMLILNWAFEDETLFREQTRETAYMVFRGYVGLDNSLEYFG